jgi:ribosomal-protein-alanine N-acetyltransferase
MSARLQPVLARRPMALRDLEAVAAIEASAYAYPWSRGNFVDSLAAGYVAEVLAGREAGIVGYFVAMPGVDELHVLNVTVAPAWQRQGHGLALLQALRDHASARRLATVWLEVREGNAGARALYRRFGFVESGLRRGYYPAAQGREDAVVMSLVVDPP